MEHETHEDKVGRSSLKGTMIAVAAICITAFFCFDKLEKTTAETAKIAQLSIDKTRAETALILAKKGIAYEYRPIIVSYRTLTANTAYQPSLSRFTDVGVSVQIACNLSLTGGQAGNWVIQTSPTSGGTYTTIKTLPSSNTGTLTIGLNTTQISGGELRSTVPPTYWYRIVSTSTTGTATFSILNQAEEKQQ